LEVDSHRAKKSKAHLCIDVGLDQTSSGGLSGEKKDDLRGLGKNEQVKNVDLELEE